MANKLISIGLTVFGVLIMAVSLLADVIGIGHHPGVGVFQLGGVLIGLVDVLVGGWLFFTRKSKNSIITQVDGITS